MVACSMSRDSAGLSTDVSSARLGCFFFLLSVVLESLQEAAYLCPWNSFLGQREASIVTTCFSGRLQMQIAQRRRKSVSCQSRDRALELPEPLGMGTRGMAGMGLWKAGLCVSRM